MREGQPKPKRGVYSLEQFRANQRDIQKGFVEWANSMLNPNFSKQEIRALNRKGWRLKAVREALLTQAYREALKENEEFDREARQKTSRVAATLQKEGRIFDNPLVDEEGFIFPLFPESDDKNS